jgi:hypothetical protein
VGTGKKPKLITNQLAITITGIILVVELLVDDWTEVDSIYYIIYIYIYLNREKERINYCSLLP